VQKITETEIGEPHLRFSDFLRYMDADGFAHGADGAFLQPGYLSLRDAQTAGNFHLRLAANKAKR
jgi:hypothetical protein